MYDRAGEFCSFSKVPYYIYYLKPIMCVNIHECIRFDTGGGGGGWFGSASTASATGACAYREGMSEEDIPLPPKLENFVSLQLESCNLVNIFRRKFRAGDE